MDFLMFGVAVAIMGFCALGVVSVAIIIASISANIKKRRDVH